MILSFKYPTSCRQITDRRLWSEINSSLVIKDRSVPASNYKLRVFTVKRINKTYLKKTKCATYDRKYFDTDKLKLIANILLYRYGINQICDYEFIEAYSNYEPMVRLELVSLGDVNASSGN